MTGFQEIRKHLAVQENKLFLKIICPCFIVLAVFLMYYFYTGPVVWRWKLTPDPIKIDPPIIVRDENPETQQGFLVYSNSCKIPDLDPYHPSIKHLIEYSAPINCSEYEPLTFTEGNILIINNATIFSRGLTNFTCCYNAIYRDKEGSSDDRYRFSKECKSFENDTYVEEEFIRVDCMGSNRSSFYRNYHSFIHDKPEVEKRCNQSDAKDTKYSVLIIGVDAVSRLNMHRQLNKTLLYLFQKMDAIEMYGFNKVGDNTFPNLVPLLLGYDERELPEVCWKSTHDSLDKCEFLWTKFKEKGYRTFYAEDTPHISSFNYQKNGFYNQPTDYYFRHFILAFENDLGRDKPLNCYRCVGSISETEAVLKWTGQFAYHFRDRPYFSFSWINSLTHDFLNMGSSGDHLYETFFRTLHESGSLNNTIIVLMGDHGMRWGEIRSTYVGRLEERLPMLLIVLPPDFREKYPTETQALKQNAHRLITPYDLHATLDNILHIERKWQSLNDSSVNSKLKDNFLKRARTLFQPIDKHRSCKDASIDEHWCTCHLSLDVDSKSRTVKYLALFIINQINALLKTRASLCEILHLDSIVQARSYNPLKSNSNNIFAVVVTAMPGNGTFEATVRFQNKPLKFELLGTISRLNLYQNQSACVHDAILKKYCYCK